ncbi:MAG: hypothetical protein HY289_00650, partial [Planctomycetes bacterium]|nr:hypothetical protein [Planctomycetota bacterium]
MTPSLADAVHAVLDRGLVVRDQADAGAPIDWDAERATLIALLDAFEVREEVVSPGGGLDLVFSETGSPEESARLTRATIRFALT